MKNMKKTIIIFTIDSPIENFGGLGESVRNLCFNLAEYNFISFGYGEKEFQSEKNITHYKITDSLNCKITDKMHISISNMNIIKDIFEKENIILIHMFDWMYKDIVFELKKTYNKKVIFTSSLSAYQKILDVYSAYKEKIPEAADRMLKRNFEEMMEMKKLEENILNEVDDVVFVSEYYKNLYDNQQNKNNEINRQKFNVIHNGIDFKDYETKIEPNKYVIPGNVNNKKILFIGRFDSMKNVTFLLETELPEGVDLIMAGSSKAGDLKFIETLLENNQLRNVYYVKFLSGEKKKYFYQNVDAVIVPSIHEPFGIVVLEAIASKTLLICSRSSGMKEIVSEDMCINCGIYSETIHEAFLKILTISDEERKKIIENAFQKIQCLTWEKNAEMYNNIYSKYIQNIL
jgi:glycosyltransferase involved in cell wall biosynthesis